MKILLTLLSCLLLNPLYSQNEPHEKLIPSTPSQLATLSDESSNLIGGIVHPLSGQPLVTSTDLVVKGAQNIILNRVYIPPHIPCVFPRHRHQQGQYDKKFLCEHLLDNYKGWQFFPQMWLEVNTRPRSSEVCLSEANGMTLAYALSGPNNSVATLPSPHYAISNACGDSPSGQYDPRNIRVSHRDNTHQFLVHSLDGTIRSYRKKTSYWKSETCLTHLYLLEKETLPNGKIIKYHYSKQLLTSLIQTYGADGQLKKEKRYTWDKKNWLQSVELRDNQNQLLSRKSYQYDRFGNPIVETFTGNLSGYGLEETFTTRRTYSEEGRNLLLREETDEGKVVCLSYLPNTNLITSRFTQDRNQIILREFNIYDDCHNLVQNLSDDGSDSHQDNLANVTQRIITNYSLRQQAPFLHMPEWVETKYLEQYQEKFLKCVHLLYDDQGNIAEEEVYDSNNQLAYTIYRTYNERGDILSETNPLNQQANYTYEPRGQLTSATNFSGRIHKTLTYDAKKRLRTELEQGDDGVTHLTLSDYDLNDRLTKKTNSFQNSTQYNYDPVTNQIAQTDFPNISSIDGQPIPVTTQATYDPFGRILTKTDANGHATHYQHNAYGSPTTITYSDGSQKQFRYQPNGLLASQTDRDGLTTQYTNDIMGRILTKTYLSPTGQNLAEETYTYSGFHLLTQTNKEGHLTQFTYDGAGRKISEETEGRVTQFAYDPLGRICTLCEKNGNNTRLTQYKRDLKDRLLEETKTDSDHHLLYKISYTYDEDDNKKTIVRTIMDQEAIDTYLHDSFGRQIEHRNALGEISLIDYEENHLNPLGQKVLQTVTTDPRHIATIETQDAFYRTLTKEIQDTDKTTLSHQELIYDPHGNLTHQRDTLYRNGQQQNTQTICYTHTSDHQVASLTRAFGTKEARTTTYSYTPTGQIASKTLPDGITLNYQYTPLGYNHTYKKYDLDGNSLLETLPGNLGDIQRMYDLLGRTTTLSSPYFKQECFYDPSGNLLSSTTHESACHYTYDGLSQLCSEQGSQNLTYTNDSLHNRTSKNNDPTELNDLNELVKHGNTLCAYDKNGNQIQQQTSTQTTHFAYDPLNRLIEATTDQQTINFVYDPLGRRLSKTIYLAETQISHENYLYDGLNEIGAFKTTGEAKNLRVLSHSKYDAPTIAIELEDQTYIPLLDVQGNIRRLVNLDTGITSTYDFTAFGETLRTSGDQNPWRFAAKRFDPELGLIYFGKRYYDPKLGRWLTTDPAGFIDSANLYQYVLNNPFKYRDPHGESVLGFLVGIGEVIVGGAICLTGGALEVATCGGYTFALGFHRNIGQNNHIPITP